MIRRWLDALARREAHRIACRKLEDDRRIREMLVGIPFAKRRNAALRATRQA